MRINMFILSSFYWWMTRFPIFRYFFTTTPPKEIWPECYCAHVQVPTGYTSKDGIVFSAFSFCGLWGTTAGTLRDNTHPHQKTQNGFSRSPWQFSSFYNGRWICFLPSRYNSSQNRNDIRGVTHQALWLRTYGSRTLRAITLASGKQTGSRCSSLRQTRLQGPS